MIQQTKALPARSATGLQRRQRVLDIVHSSFPVLHSSFACRRIAIAIPRMKNEE
jgi:hypothetical protein